MSLGHVHLYFSETCVFSPERRVGILFVPAFAVFYYDLITDKSLHMAWCEPTNEETKVFLSSLRWGDLSGELVMDVGCGMGNMSTKCILQLFPRLSQIVAIDKDPYCIHRSKVEFKQEIFKKAKFFRASITDWEELQKWKGAVSKIVSVHCLSFVKRHERAFRNMFELLKPGGEAALLFVIRSESDDVYLEMAKRPKWSEYFKSLNIPMVMKLRESDPAYYSNMLKNIGFLVLFCREQTTEHVYYDDKEYKDPACHWLSNMLSETLYNSFVTETFNFAAAIQSSELRWDPDVRKGELVMDVGCGINQVSTDFISQRYINAKKLCIDNDPEVIKYFNKKNTSDEYAEVDILDWSQMVELEGSVSKVVAFRSLSEVEDQQRAFEIIFRLLKVGGDVLIILTINSLLHHFLKIVVEKERWEKYFKGKYVIPESHTREFTADYYKRLLHSIGFEIVDIAEVPRIVTYKSIVDFRDDVFHSNVSRYIPEDHQQEFAIEVATFAEFHRSKFGSNEYLNIQYNTLWIYAVKSQPAMILPR